MDGTQATTELTDAADELYRNYYRDAIGTLSLHYPQEQRSLELDFQDLYRFDPDLADDLLEHPGDIIDVLEEGLRLYDKPIDVELGQAHVRVHNLPDEYTYFPTEFSPTEEAGGYRTIRGDVLVSTETYSKIEVAAFECERCGCLTRIPQTDGDFQEPHECQGCERQGPFNINHDQSEMVDGETIQLQTPPEVAGGAGRTLQVFVEDDATDKVEMGDRIAVSGVLHLNQKTKGRNQKTGQFEPYLDGHHIQIEEATQANMEINAETRSEVEALAAGEKGDPLTVAADSLHPGVYGYDTEKRALILAIIGGATNTPDVRGKFHVLFIGDPSTGKSQLINRVNEIAARSISVSGQQSTSAGLVSTATQGEFSDGRWTLSPGAFVKANEGVVTIDELDDMDPDHRSSMLEPMANQKVSVSKAGINATLSTKTAVLAAANPNGSRFDPFDALAEQFGFASNLISRFDLVFTFRDQPDQEDDADIGNHVTQFRDAKIRAERGENIPEEQQEVVEKPVSDDTLRIWLALANQQPDPVYESDEVRQQLVDSFVTLRGANGYAEDAEVPVTFRKLPGVERIARAHAKLEFSPVITERHAEQAMGMVGKSMQDYQKTEDGKFDADIAETGSSKSQKKRADLIEDTIKDLQSASDDDMAKVDKVIAELDGDVDADRVEDHIQKLMHRKGEAIEPRTGYVRYLGEW